MAQPLPERMVNILGISAYCHDSAAVLAAREVLALPIYAELSEEQQRTVTRAIGGFLL